MAAAVAWLTSCTTDPYTGERKVSKTAWGAGIGAAGGAAIGALVGDHGRERRKNALIGAGAGALAGGGVGYYMDRQESKLRAQLEGTGVSVTRVGDNIMLNMPGNITFAHNRSDLRPDFYEVLNSVVLVVKEFDKTLVEVAGHTDSTGADTYNLELSEKRASSVSRYLSAQGIDHRRLYTQGLGEAQPVANNDSPAGRAQNRRVELILVPLTA